jgi:hypothetical protein
MNAVFARHRNLVDLGTRGACHAGDERDHQASGMHVVPFADGGSAPERGVRRRPQ